MVVVAVLGGHCPPAEVVEPCTCSEAGRKLICIKLNSYEFNSTHNLTHVFENINKSVGLEDKTFNELMIANTETLELHENIFKDIRFKKLWIMENNLTRIHSKVFFKTYSTVKEVYMNLNSVKNSENYQIFEALSSLTSLEVLSLDLGIHSIGQIPEYAFKNVKGTQSNLREVNINGLIGSIGQYAFAQLPNLRRLRVLDQLYTVGSHSLEFKSKSDNDLEIDLSFNKLTANNLEPNCFSNMRRPVHLILNSNEIKYIDKPVFEPFLDADKYNKISIKHNPINCSDCRSYWVRKDKNKMKNRLVDGFCHTGDSFWDHKWQCNAGSSHVSLRVSKVLFIFIAIKIIAIKVFRF